MNIDDIDFIINAYRYNSTGMPKEMDMTTENIKIHFLDKMNSKENFKIQDIIFEFIDGEYQVSTHGEACETLFDVIYKNGHFLENVYIIKYLKLKDIMKTNDIHRAIQLQCVINNSACVFSPTENKYITINPFSCDIYKELMDAVDARLPIRLYPTTEHNKFVNINNINGVYMLFDPFNNITEDDKFYINQAKVMNNI